MRPFNALIHALPRLMYLSASGAGAWVAPLLVETAPGKQMQIEFRQTRVLIGGESVRVFVFVATLGYSRRGFACAFRHARQRLGHAHE